MNLFGEEDRLSKVEKRLDQAIEAGQSLNGWVQESQRIDQRVNELSTQLEQITEELDNIHIDVSMKPYEVRGLDIQHDTVMMKQAIVDAGEGGSLYIPFSFEINDTLAFLKNQNIKGKGVRKTIIFARIPKPIILPPAEKGSIDGVTIIGRNVKGSIGILMDNEHRPYNTRWGSVEIRDCDIGIKTDNTKGGIAYNSFERIECQQCNIGMDLYTPSSQTGFITANAFNYTLLHKCSTGARFNGVSGLTFNFLEAENCNIGLDVVKGESIHIKHGWIEDNVVNINLTKYPEVSNFVYDGIIDRNPTNFDSTSMDRSSTLLTFREGGGNIKALLGKWYAHRLDGLPEHDLSMTINNPILGGYGLKYKSVSSGSEIDITGINALNIAYTKPTEITNLIRSGAYANHRSGRYQQVIIVSATKHGYIKNGGNFRLNNNEDWVPTSQGATITLVYNPFKSNWVEISRTN